MQTAIEQLAKEMNVSVADVRCLAQSVANSITADRAATEFVESSEQDQVEFALAYVEQDSRKLNQFISKYLTSDEARNVFQARVKSILVN